eukprot:CAMPEP_0179126636 /NCGR_PEP_ID=MMETSP0796-20121207/59951_1 /TAXON_ID=73915 /ORGANISM="Pyrodinium bahamense, Strain pbaha01" /LENGTH=234 /DNA_ID=CAMNT_0020825391 /DNA_START=140 /DNA_END=841 /DNA_ORIENTATION=+
MLRCFALLVAGTLARAQDDVVGNRPVLGRQLKAAGLGNDPAAALPNTSAAIVRGLVEAFLHKQDLPQEELACLVNGTGELARSIMRVASRTVILTQAIIGQRPAAKGLMAPTSTEALDSRRLEEEEEALDGILGVALGASKVFLELGMSIQKIALLSHHMVKDCIRGDALKALKVAAEHMRNVKYIAGHVQANGADIVHEIGDAVSCWHDEKYRCFGRNMGTALRKVLLSSDTG